MKLVIGTAFIVCFLILGILGFFLFKLYRTDHKLAGIVKKIILFADLAVFFNIISLFAKSEFVCSFSQSIYFITTIWLMYFLFRFSIEYIGSKFEDFVKVRVMHTILIADTVSVLLNNVFNHLFTLKEITSYGEKYFEMITTPWYYTHYAIIIMLVVLCLITLLYRTFKAPVFYRAKYGIIAGILIVLVFVNIATKKSAVDFSVLGYVVECVCIYYCAIIYTPQRLLSKTLYSVAKDMSVGLFVIDIEGKKLYSNQYAENLLVSDEPLVDKKNVTLEQWCRNRYMNYTDEFTKERTFYKDDEEFILKIQLQRMIDSKKQLQGGYFVIQDCTEEYHKLKKERYVATHDTLTDLYNKEYFYRKAEKYIRNHQEEELYIICTDIKDFKMINDFFGTKIGDKVLISFAEILRKSLKDAVVYGRIGNDIFGILMPKDKYDEKKFVEEAQKAFLSCIDQNTAFPTINYIGIYEVTERNLPISVMCDRARMAISTIKGDYHKYIAYYDNTLRDNILYEQELIGELESSIAEKHFKMYLQPQMSTDGKMLGAEALVRWIHPVKGMIMPGAFIPVFEKNGLISEVDKYIWETACCQLKKWKDEGREDVYISVNISPRDFYFLNIYQIFTDLINKYDISPRSIKLEITETAVVMDFNRQLDLISRLRKKGFIVEMDDFGSGYSSLNMLKDIHVDVLKIDMAFLRKAEDEERSKKILQMIITLSKQLDMPVITEGVETEEQIKFLSEMGCDMFQGYYFAKPMSVDDFETRYFN